MNVPHPETLMTLFRRHFTDLVRRLPSATFLYDERVGVFNNQQTFEISLEVAKRLYDIGLRPGDALMIKATRSASATLLFFATQMLGVIAVMMDARQDEKPIYAVDSRIKGVAYQPDENGAICDWIIEFNGVTASCVIPQEPHQGIEFPDIQYGDDDDAVWVFTSGSEGHFKIVRHSQQRLFSHVLRYAEPCCCGVNDRAIVLLPIYHVFGLALIYFPVAVGGSLYFPPSLDLDDVIDYVIAKQITYLDQVPSFHYMLVKRVQARGIKFTSLRNGLTAGAPMEESRFREIEETLGMNLLPVYGASEIITISALPDSAPQDRRRLTVGQPLVGTDLQIIDESGNQLPLGEPGEIVVRSPSLMLGYLGKDSGLDEKGFFATGDIGYLDENGDLHITGRKKQIIIRNGNNLSTVEIENNLLRVDGIENACVVGLPDARAGEVPAAMIVLRSGMDAKAARSAIEAALAKNMWPDTYEFVAALPLLPSGKADRVAIKQRLLSIKAC